MWHMLKVVTRAIPRPTLNTATLIVLVSLWIALLDNLALWRHIGNQLDLTSTEGAGYVLTLYVLLTSIIALPIIFLTPRVLLKPLLLILVVVCGSLAYFTYQLGVVFNVDMIRNMMETLRDGNTQEGAELLSTSWAAFMLIGCAIPVVLIWRCRLVEDSLLRSIGRRAVWSAALMAIVGTLVLVNFKHVVYFSRENKNLKVYLNPIYPLISTRKYFSLLNTVSERDFVELGTDAVQKKAASGRTVGVMVVGETARADHWSLNGYQRDTNPLLSQRRLVNFTQARSCGTSTAFSVPCMFSFLMEEDYTPENAASQSNTLDVLQGAGVHVFWADSNSSCKGVCRRVGSENIMRKPDPSSKLWKAGAWYDEILVQKLSAYIDAADPQQDVLIVLHGLGSHGPAYYRRYPEEFARFAPYCLSKAPQDCPKQEIVNAYDNTLIYTDYVLDSVIELLDKRAESTFMFYASDHGESLGENGIYLHGLPNFLAPESQRHIPMFAWFSDRYAQTHALRARGDVQRQDGREVSHDHISSSLLGLFEVQSNVYRPELDLFRANSPLYANKIAPLDQQNELSQQP